MNSRRTFVLGAGSALAVNVAARKVAASDKIRVAVLGVNGRGKDHIKGFQSQPGAEVVMLCDPDRSVADERALEFFDAYQKPVKVVQDLRRVFDNKDIDAVSIATPNHWHALATIWPARRQGCVRGKARRAQHLGRAPDGGGGAQIQSHRAARCPVAQLEALQEAVRLLREA